MLSPLPSPLLRISGDALRHNYRLLARRLSPASLIPVLKANAYGHGARLLLPLLLEEGASVFAVASGTEALSLGAFFQKSEEECKSSFTYKPILLILGTVAEEELADLCALRVVLSVHSPAYVAALEASLMHRRARGILPDGFRMPVAIKCECGMNRLGFSRISDTLSLFSSEALTPVMLYSHLGETDSPRFREGRDRFSVFVSLLSHTGHPLFTHLAASPALPYGGALGCEAARVGLAFYGLSEGIEGLRAVMRFCAAVLSVKRVRKGEGIGYGSYRAPRDMRVACLAAGYADGIPPSARRARVRLSDRLVPIVGELCMDRLFLEIGEMPLQEGDEVTLFGADAADTRRFAAECAVTPYQLLSVRSERSRRILS